MALQRQQPKSTALQLTAVAVAVLCPWLAVSVPLSDWHSGIATNYGGAQDGMSPYDPSFGTKEVRKQAYQAISAGTGLQVSSSLCHSLQGLHCAGLSLGV